MTTMANTRQNISVFLSHQDTRDPPFPCHFHAISMWETRFCWRRLHKPLISRSMLISHAAGSIHCVIIDGFYGVQDWQMKSQRYEHGVLITAAGIVQRLGSSSRSTIRHWEALCAREYVRPAKETQ